MPPLPGASVAGPVLLVLVLAAGLLAGLLVGRRRIEAWRRRATALAAANEGLQAALVSLEEAAGTDRLTGAWNRRRFEEAATAEIALARRRRDPVCLLLLDLDHFKAVNDRLGHEAGDAVLAGSVQAWRMALRASDQLCRWGGEEFVVLCPATRMDGALALGEKLREAMAEVRFPGLGPVTVSAGAAEYAAGESLEGWVQRADRALYHAKAEGRDRVLAAEAPAPGDLEPRPLLELHWEEACASGHALIDGQHRRLFELANGLLASLTLDLPREESLLRWNRLLAHAAQHFNDEERVLARAGYARLAGHAAAHQALLARARDFQRDLEAGQANLGRVVDFLAMDLVKGHLLQEDRDFFPLLADTGPPGVHAG